MEKASIFVADDNQPFLGIMRELLEDEGYQVAVWQAGGNPFEKIRECLPDLVILDLTLELPDAGWQVLETLKLDPTTAHIPVILCSGDVWALRNKSEQLLRLGCHAIEKPFDLNSMLYTVEQALTCGAN